MVKPYHSSGISLFPTIDSSSFLILIVAREHWLLLQGRWLNTGPPLAQLGRFQLHICSETGQLYVFSLVGLPIRQISIDPFFSLQVFALFELVQVGSMTRFEKKKNKRTNNNNNKTEVKREISFGIFSSAK